MFIGASFCQRAARCAKPLRGFDSSFPKSEAFAQRLREKLQANHREPSGGRRLGRWVSEEQIVRAVEAAKGETRDTFRDRHGDWGRDMALWLGRRFGRLTLGELAQRAGRVDYPTAGAAVSRLTRRLERDPKLRRAVETRKRKLSKSEM